MYSWRKHKIQSTIMFFFPLLQYYRNSAQYTMVFKFDIYALITLCLYPTHISVLLCIFNLTSWLLTCWRYVLILFYIPFHFKGHIQKLRIDIKKSRNVMKSDEWIFIVFYVMHVLKDITLRWHDLKFWMFWQKMLALFHSKKKIPFGVVFTFPSQQTHIYWMK